MARVNFLICRDIVQNKDRATLKLMVVMVRDRDGEIRQERRVLRSVSILQSSVPTLLLPHKTVRFPQNQKSLPTTFERGWVSTASIRWRA